MMKKKICLLMVLALCFGIGTACAETTFVAKQIESYGLELNTKTNTLIMRDPETREYAVVDKDLNQLSDKYASIQTKGKYFTVMNEELHAGLLDGQGKLIMPLEFGAFEILSDRWIAGIRLRPSTDSDENPDYRSFWGNGSYMIDTVDLYYNGDLKGSVTRSDWDGCYAYGDYICLRDREKNYSFYNKDFVKSDIISDTSREYTEDYKTKTMIHNGSNQTAFTAGCTLKSEEVKQSVWVNYEYQLVDLQGNVLADMASYDSAKVDVDSNLVNLRTKDKKRGLADREGKEMIPCIYDNFATEFSSALVSGYIYAEKVGKAGFVNLSTGEETGFTFTQEASKQRANFIVVEDAKEGTILVSAYAGELPGRYKDVNVTFRNEDGKACLFAAVKDQEGKCRIIGQMGEDILPGVEFENIYDINISDDGTLILKREEYGKYTLYTVNYNPDKSAIPAPVQAVEETWTCENGHEGLTSRFCPECGAKRPE